jgi:hypothetical protein
MGSAAAAAAAVETVVGAKTLAGQHVARVPVSDAAAHVVEIILYKQQHKATSAAS